MPFRPSILLQPFNPPLETIRHYNLHKLRRDLVAGVTVAVVEAPQAMAYAVIAGVPPVYGIYTSIIQGIIGAMLSSSEHLTTGPTNTQSLLIASAVTRLANPETTPEQYLQLVFALTMLKGVIQLAFAAARMGDMVRYVSRSVIVGLVGGAGFLIFFGQLPSFIGITSSPPHPGPGIIGPLQRLIAHASTEFNPRALMIGVGVLCIVLAVRKISRFLPGALLAVVLSAVVVWLMRWTSQELPLIQKLPVGLPHFQSPIPSLNQAESLLGGALALAMVGMLESVAIAKNIAGKTGERISANQEFFAQGLKNFATSFFQCIPGSGSFTRSALDYEAGAQTRFAAVFNALFVACIFFLLGQQAGFIPQASLAAVLFTIAWGLVDWGYIPKMLRVSRSDAAVCAITFLATLALPLEYAVFIGVFLNIALYLRQTSKLKMSQMVQSASGPFHERPLHDHTGVQRVMFLSVEGDLYFGVADELQDQLTALTHSGMRIVILRLKRTHSIDATVLKVLEQFALDLKSRGGHVILCGVRRELLDVIEAYGLLKIIGKENAFETAEGVFTSAKQALQRARELVGGDVELTGLEEHELEEVSYEI
jgi:SulP family sulfate permease